MPIDYRKIGPAVQNGKVRYLSVSAVTKFDPSSFGGCPARWYNHYVLGDKEPGTKAQEIGTEIHRQLAEYMRGNPVELSPYAAQALPLLPKPHPYLQLEWSIAEERGGKIVSALNSAKVPFVGEIDFFDRANGAVIDYKTTSKKETDLPASSEVVNTIQMTGYGVVAGHSTELNDKISLGHLYIGTKKKYAKLIHETQTTKEITARWDAKVTPLVEQIKSVAGEKDLKNVPKNQDSCHAWHRTCKYYSKCFPNPLDELLTIGLPNTEGENMSLLSRLNRKSSEEPKPLPPPGGQGVDGPFYTPQQQDLLGVDKQGNKLVIEDHYEKVLPPDAPPSDPTKNAMPPPEGEPVPPAAQEKLDKLVTEPKKRGRAAKATASAAEGQPSPSVDATGTIFIAVDAIAVGFESLVPYVDSLVQTLNKTANVLDVRTIRDKDSPLAFGGWRGVLAALARKDPPPPGAYAVASNEFVDAVLEGLETKAKIARGRR